MDSYDKLLVDLGTFRVGYRDVLPEDMDEVNDYVNLLIFQEEYVNSVDVYTDVWLSLVKTCEDSPLCSYNKCTTVNGHEYYIMIGSGD